MKENQVRSHELELRKICKMVKDLKYMNHRCIATSKSMGERLLLRDSSIMSYASAKSYFEMVKKHDLTEGDWYPEDSMHG